MKLILCHATLSVMACCETVETLLIPVFGVRVNYPRIRTRKHE